MAIKIITIFILAISHVNGYFVASKGIYHGVQITNSNTVFLKGNRDFGCKLLKKKDLEASHFKASHYIKKGKPICQKDVKAMKNSKVVYKFGDFLEVLENGEFINETNRYVKIRKPDGKIKKVDKDWK